MLIALRIKNLALVDDLTLEPGPGYTAITGETGAGKSILIGALNLVLGQRADRTLLRAGCDACTVEANFTTERLDPAIHSLLREHGLEPCADGQLLLKRVFTAAGANRQFVNGSPATLAALAALGEWLVDIHGPHDHQSLLHPTRQLEVLDAHGGLIGDRESFAGLVRERDALLKSKAALIVDEETYVQQLDLLRFQVKEIRAAQLQPGEDGTVEEEFHRTANAARLIELSRAALGALSENEESLATQSALATRLLQELQRLDPSANPLLEQQERLAENLRDLSSDLSRYAEKVEVDPQRLQELEARLNLLQSLKRKYGPTLADVIAFGEEAARRLVALEGRDAELERINAQLEAVNTRLLKAGQTLATRRRHIAPRLATAVSSELEELGFRQSRLEAQLTSHPPTAPLRDDERLRASGFDTVEFQFAPNPGEPARPLRAIASSGELARVMLALKVVLAATDAIPLLVFDEVDANVGGETAHTVGAKMKGIARQRQVLCVTHLPQVAAPAQQHLIVSKREVDGRTLTRVDSAMGTERITELARMLGGGQAARQHAIEMLDGKSGPAPSRKPPGKSRSLDRN